MTETFWILQVSLKWLTSKGNLQSLAVRAQYSSFEKYYVCQVEGKVWKALDILGIKLPELEVICLPKFWQHEIKQL